MDVYDPAGAMTAEETAFFESGGTTAISDPDAGTGANPGGGSDTGNANGDAGGTDTKPKGEQKPEGNENVPLARFLDEKKARKELDKQNRDLQTQIAELRGKFSILERLNPKAGEGQNEQPAAPPSPEEDIFGAVKHVGETVAQMQKRLDDQAAADKAAGEQTTFVNNYRSDAARFEQTNPDFKAAYNHLLQSRANELIAIGYDDPAQLKAAGATDQEIHAAAKALHDALTADEFAIADLAFKRGKSPAEIIYGLAKQRGYAKAAPKGADADADAAKAAAEKLATIERGQNANKSLNGTGGNAGDDDMTADRLLSMPIDEFERWVDKNPAKARRIMGG